MGRICPHDSYFTNRLIWRMSNRTLALLKTTKKSKHIVYQLHSISFSKAKFLRTLVIEVVLSIYRNEVYRFLTWLVKFKQKKTLKDQDFDFKAWEWWNVKQNPHPLTVTRTSGLLVVFPMYSGVVVQNLIQSAGGMFCNVHECREIGIFFDILIPH